MKKERHLLLWFLVLASAVLTVVDIYSLSSGKEKAILFGLSLPRLGIALIPLVLILFSAAIMVWIIAAPVAYIRFRMIIKQFIAPGAILSTCICFWSALIMGGMILIYHQVILPNAATLTPKLGFLFPNLLAYLDRLLPLFSLITICLALWFIYGIFFLKRLLFQNIGLLTACGAGVLSIFAALFQWVVFTFRLHVFEQIPGWYWPIILKPDFVPHAFLFGLFLVISLVLAYLIKRFPRLTLLNLLGICLLFIALQFSIGYMEGRGAASLTDRFFLSYHRYYDQFACNTRFSALTAITHYENLPYHEYLQTKPPGVLSMYFAINQLANTPGLSSILDELSKSINLSIPLHVLSAGGCQRSMVLVTFLFPILAVMVVWALYVFSRQLPGGVDHHLIAGYSALIVVLAPNFVMLSLFLDQALYPALFLFMAGGLCFAMQKKSFAGCFLLGAAIYAAIFISFSMLPLLIIPVFYYACVLWQGNILKAAWINFKQTLLPMGLGGVLSIVLFKLLLNYDIYTRFQGMIAAEVTGDFYTRMHVHPAASSTILERISQTFSAAILNNMDLAVAIGFPIFILFVVFGVISVIHIVKRKPGGANAINASLFLTYTALNLAAAVNGEVGRVWMFWTPVMALFSVQYLLPLIKQRQWILYALITLQVITLFLTYQYQDYLMPQLLP